MQHPQTLSLLESSWESADIVGELAVVGQELDVSTIDQDLSGGLLLHILFTTERSESPVLGNNDLLATRELVLGSTKSLESGSTVCRNIRKDSPTKPPHDSLESRVRTLRMI